MHHEHSRLTKQALYHIRFRAGLLILKPQFSYLFTPLEIMAHCSVAGLHFRIILAGFNAPLEFLTGFTQSLVLSTQSLLLSPVLSVSPLIQWASQFPFHVVTKDPKGKDT
jgi:hypothetical protein